MTHSKQALEARRGRTSFVSWRGAGAPPDCAVAAREDDHDNPVLQESGDKTSQCAVTAASEGSPSTPPLCGLPPARGSPRGVGTVPPPPPPNRTRRPCPRVPPTGGHRTGRPEAKGHARETDGGGEEGAVPGPSGLPPAPGRGGPTGGLPQPQLRDGSGQSGRGAGAGQCGGLPRVCGGADSARGTPVHCPPSCGGVVSCLRPPDRPTDPPDRRTAAPPNPPDRGTTGTPTRRPAGTPNLGPTGGLTAFVDKAQPALDSAVVRSWLLLGFSWWT